MADRLVAIWDNGAFVSTDAISTPTDFQEVLDELVEAHGPPTTVEFRKADEGFILGPLSEPEDGACAHCNKTECFAENMCPDRLSDKED